MTIQWILVASFLYLELGIIVLLSLPFISPKIWMCIFHFRLWATLGKKANMYFTVFLMVLVLFFFDSIREMIKYSGDHKHQFDAELQTHMKLYRSQRNYFIVGFAIFLCFVIRRLCMLLLVEAELLIRNEDIAISAQDATTTMEKLLKQKKEYDESVAKMAPSENAIKKIERIQKKIDAKNKEIKTIKESIENIQNQNQEVSMEYERMKAKVDNLKDFLAIPSE